jgi:hypothetical protein
MKYNLFYYVNFATYGINYVRDELRYSVVYNKILDLSFS